MSVSLYIIAAKLRSDDDDYPFNLCKIGISKNVRLRLRNLKTSSPYPLKIYSIWDCGSLPVALAAERITHKRLNNFRAHGEWFHLRPEIADYVIQRWCWDVALRLGYDVQPQDRDFPT